MQQQRWALPQRFLCLLQAAWALRQHRQGAPLYGLPTGMDPLEGWIVLSTAPGR